MLQQELLRKDRALAVAAALLIASKRIQAYWGEDEGDDPAGGSPQELWRSSMPPWSPEHGPIRWLSCWVWGPPPCSDVDGSLRLMGKDWIAVNAAPDTFLTG
jgi:hypothetical protein